MTITEPTEARRLDRISLQLTPEQRDWLDARSRRSQTYSRSAEVRSIVQEALEREREAAALADVEAA